MCVHFNRQPKPYAVSTITWILAVRIQIACVDMIIHAALTQVNIFRVQALSMHIYTKVKSSMDIYVHVSICAFDLSTNAWVHVNRKHYALSKITWMCAYMSALATTQVIIMCVHRQQPVCVSTFTTKSLSCVHAYMYVHSFIAFDPCMYVHVNRQPKPNAVSTTTWILAVITHIACIGTYIHVIISYNPTQHISCTSFMSMHIYTKVKSSMDIYVHVSICAFDLSTNAWVHVNRQLVKNNLNMCTQVNIGFNASHHHVWTSTTACMSKHIYYKVSCVHVYMYVHSFIPFDPCMCVHVNRQLKSYAVSTITWILAVTIHIACIGMSIHVNRQPKSDNNLNISCHNSHQHYALSKITWMCAHVSIGFNVSHHHVCMSTTACMSKHIYYKVSCIHVYKYVHSFIAFDPCMCVHINRQPKPYAVSTITWILAVTIHIACIGMYIHVSISFNVNIFRVQALCLHIYTKLKSSMDIYVHVSIQLMHGYMSIVNTMPCRK